MPDLAEKIDQETDRILLKLIDSAAKQAEEEIEKTGTLTMDHAVPLLLKSQYNHILHLDHELVAIRNIMDERFGTMDGRLGKMDERFSRMDEKFGRMDEKFSSMFIALNGRVSDLYKWMFGCFLGTITILGGLMTYLQFFVQR